MDEVLSSIRRFVVAGRNSGANFSQQAAASRSIIETSRRLRSGLRGGGIDGPLSEDLRRELDDLTSELLRDAEELLSDVAPRPPDENRADSGDQDGSDVAGAGRMAPAPPPETLNFTPRRPQSPSPIRRHMADAAMSAGELPSVRRKSLASMIADGDLGQPVREEAQETADPLADEDDQAAFADDLEAEAEDSSAMEIDAVAARRAAMRLGRRDDAPTVSKTAQDDGPVWDDDDEPGEEGAQEGWGALNNLLRLAENALRDLELHDAAAGSPPRRR